MSTKTQQTARIVGPWFWPSKIVAGDIFSDKRFRAAKAERPQINKFRTGNQSRKKL
jgi:hypothetical protein